MEHTIWMRIRNWAENWCQIFCGILFSICCMTSSARALNSSCALRFVRNYWDTRTPSRKTDANLDWAFVEKRTFHLRSLILKSQQNRIELVARPGQVLEFGLDYPTLLPTILKLFLVDQIEPELNVGLSATAAPPVRRLCLWDLVTFGVVVVAFGHPKVWRVVTSRDGWPQTSIQTVMRRRGSSCSQFGLSLLQPRADLRQKLGIVDFPLLETVFLG